jgi:hypothetical protein
LGDAKPRGVLFEGVDSKDATPDQKAEAYACAAQQKTMPQLADMNKAVSCSQEPYLRLRAQQLYEKEKYKERRR